MKFSRWLILLTLLAIFSGTILEAQTTINVPASALSNGQPGANGKPFTFILDNDATVTVKALFMTHWLTLTANVVANPKATRFIVDAKSYPLATGNEDFYGYMEPSLWPERSVRRDQMITIEESVTLTKGPHTIQFLNGLMDRDDSRFVVVYSTADWATATITYGIGGDEKKRGAITLLPAIPVPPTISMDPVTQSILEGARSTFTLSSLGATKSEFSGTDGTFIANPASSISVAPGAGTYTFTYTASGKAILRWAAIRADIIWIDLPTGSSVDVTNELIFTATQSGNYVLRAIMGTETASAPFHVDLPTAAATATLTVTKAPVAAGGPVVSAFSPIEANYTVTSGPAAGHSYGRSWQGDGVWSAYLGRDGVSFRVVGASGGGAVTSFEIQAKGPAGEWSPLVSGSPAAEVANGPGVSVAQTFSVRLGAVRADKPLLPADPSLVGTWTLRARVSDATGAWSPWSFEQPLKVLYPVKDVVLTGRTLPPVEDAAWFTASPEKQYNAQVLVP